MAKSGSKAKVGSNGVDPAKIGGFVAQILDCHAEKESSKSKHMTRCKEINGEINDVLDSAKDAGFTKKIIRKQVQRVLAARRHDKIRDDLEFEDQDILDQYEHAYAQHRGTPLGEAPVDKTLAADKAEPADEAADDDDDAGEDEPEDGEDGVGVDGAPAAANEDFDLDSHSDVKH